MNKQDLYYSGYDIYDHKVYIFSMPLITSNMFIMTKGENALVIDPNENEEAFLLLEENGIKKVDIILTHEHFDHISGVNAFRERFDTCVWGSESCALLVSNPSKNLSAFFMAMFISKSKEDQDKAKKLFSADYCCMIDNTFLQDMDVNILDMPIRMVETKGHSPGSICIIIDDRYLFSGDSLIPGEKVITRLPGGSKNTYNEQTRPFLLSLNKEIICFPGHGKPAVLKELLL